MSLQKMRDQVKAYAARILLRQRSIEIVWDNIDPLLDEMRLLRRFDPAPSAVDLTETVYRELFFGAVNFAFVHPRKGCRLRMKGLEVFGSTAFRAAMFGKGFVWSDLDAASNLRISDWRYLLSDLDLETLHFAERRRKNLRALGKHLKHRIGRDPKNLRPHLRSPDRLFGLLHESRCFRDPFYKRLQATISCVYNYFPATKSIRGGLSQLTGLADYRLPQLFCNYGVITILDAGSARKLAAMSAFSRESAFILALRAGTIVIVEVIAKSLGCSEIQADWALWRHAESCVNNSKFCIQPVVVNTDEF